MNQVTLIGHTGNDPEVLTFSNGQKMAIISLATTKTWKSKEGEKKSHTTWHKVKISGPLAEVVERYVTKGAHLAITGDYLNEEYIDKEGNKRRDFFVRVNNLHMLSKRDSGGSQGPQDQSSPEPDDDLPF